MKQISIKTKFSVLVGILITIVVGTISIILLNNEKKELIRRIKRQGYISVKSLAHISVEGITTSDELLIYQTINDIMKEEGIIEVFILDEEGKVLYHNDIKEVEKVYDPKIWHADYDEEAVDFEPRLYEKEGHKIYDFFYPIKAKTFEKGRKEKALLGIAHIQFSYKIVQKVLRKATLTVFLVTLAILIIGVGASFLLTQYVVQPIMKIAKGAKEIGQGNLEYKIAVHTKDELELLANQFNVMTGQLAEAQQMMLEQERLQYELDIATNIQKSLIPKKIPKYSGIEISAYYNSAKEVGGDYYDFFDLDEKRLGIVVADVSGKGVPGAMVMVMVRSILKAEAYSNRTAFNTMVKTNKYIFKDIQPGMFVTAFYGILDTEKKMLQFVNAGHNHLIVYKKNQNKCETYSEPGIPLGIQDSAGFQDTMRGKMLKLEKGDIVIQYTDGITEAKNISHDEFEMDRLIQSIVNNNTLSTDLLIKAIMNDVKKFCGDAPQYDDIAIVAIRV